MKIAFIVNQFPNLSETFIFDQIKGLAKRGHLVDVFTFFDSAGFGFFPSGLINEIYYIKMPFNKFKRVFKAILYTPFKIIKNPYLTLESLNLFKYGQEVFSLRFFYFVLALSKKRRYDIVHCQYGPLGGVGIFLKKIGMVEGKIIVSFRGYDLSERVMKQNRKTYSFLFKEADLILPVCLYFKKLLLQKACDVDKTIVHRSGTDISLFKHKRYSRKEVINLLSVCRLVEKKGLDYAIRAVGNVVKKHPEFKLKYLIIGEGPLKKHLVAITLKLGLENVICFLGGRRHGEVAEIMQGSDIFLAPSVISKREGYEGIPGVIREALACGLPVLATNHGGIPEVVRDGESGFLVPERNTIALTEKLEFLIKRREKWPEMGSFGRGIIKKYYDINRLNNDLVKRYEELLDKN